MPEPIYDVITDEPDETLRQKWDYERYGLLQTQGIFAKTLILNPREAHRIAKFIQENVPKG